jgi:hypothetical protein
MSGLADVLANLIRELSEHLRPGVFGRAFDEIIPANRDNYLPGMLDESGPKFFGIGSDVIREALRQ